MPQPQCKPGWAPGGEAQARGGHACNPASISARWNTGSDRGMSGERASLCRAPAAAVPAPAGRRTGAMGSARNHAARPRRAEKGIRPLREATQGAAEKRLLPPQRESLPAEKALREAGLKQEGRLCKENARFALEGCAAGSCGVVREKDQARRLALCALGFRDGKHAAGTFRRRGVTAGPSCKRRASDRGFFHLG